MRTLVIRRLPDEVYSKLKLAAEEYNTSMEGLARTIIVTAIEFYNLETNEYVNVNKSVIGAAVLTEEPNGSETTP